MTFLRGEVVSGVVPWGMCVMAVVVPPRPPAQVAAGDDDRLQRLRFRLFQLLWTMITIFVTVWVMLLGIPILSITALATAKHVLVAIYLMGLHTDSIRD
jgi:hypothetical protein